MTAICFLQFSLLLYLSQQKQVTSAKIHPEFMLTVSSDKMDGQEKHCFKLHPTRLKVLHNLWIKLINHSSDL